MNDAVQDTLPDTERDDPRGRPAATDDDPKLCPMPMKDTPHGASPAALNYEDDVHARVNPVAPIPRGFGVNMPNPATGALVYFDDCFRYAGDLVDGDMTAGDLVDAKGPGYAGLLSSGIGDYVMQDLIDRATKQLGVTDSRGVRLKWYFAEQEAADSVRRRFASEKLRGIVISTMPPVSR